MNEKKMIEKEKIYIKFVIILLNNSSICPVEKKQQRFQRILGKENTAGKKDIVLYVQLIFKLVNLF